MAESVFEAVKQSVTVREAAQMYGIEVNRSGMACCPFHDDKNPSMKLNEEYFYCFGCGATGDVIDFMNVPSLRKSSGICITISAMKPENPGICPALPTIQGAVSRKNPRGLPSS